MTEQQIVETLATKVMGWEKLEVELDLTDGGTQKFYDSWRMNGREVATHWSPLHNIADAWMIVEKMAEENNMKFHSILSKWGIFGMTPKTISLSAYEAVIGNEVVLTKR